MARKNESSGDLNAKYSHCLIHAFARYDSTYILNNVMKYKIVDDLLQCKQGRYK